MSEGVQTEMDTPGPAAGAVPRPILAIFLVSFLGLFLEMLLIRWIGTEIRIFAYLQNTILVVCLLGLGLGCLTARKPASIGRTPIPLLVLVFLLSFPVTATVFASISGNLSILDSFLIWYSAVGLGPFLKTFQVGLGLGLTLCVLVLVHDTFVPLGRLLGRLMDDHPKTIVAYSWNVAGSLLGIWAFVALSALYQPPLAWFVVLVGLFLILRSSLGQWRRLELVLLPAFIVLLAWNSWSSQSTATLWSPYQKLSLRKTQELEVGDYVIDVNNVPYQAIIGMGSSARAPGESDQVAGETTGLGQYDLPLLLHPRPESVLIVGAGAGNDAAGALRQGAKQITAVEIDPGIYELGKTYHPDLPYSSPQVEMVIDDARSYFTNSKASFDVIAFGLLDSHTTTSLMNARLDHYVYTEESFRKARSLLKPDGIMTVTFVPQKPYIADRLASVLLEVFQTKPLILQLETSRHGWGGLMFVSGNMETVEHQLEAHPEVAEAIRTGRAEDTLGITYTTATATDDWPYIYLKSRGIPVLFFLIGGLLLVLFARSVKHWEAVDMFQKWDREHWHFFFLGAAFLLLEVTNISRSAVVLGNTWLVNAVIVSGVLTMILLANGLASTSLRLPIRVFYACLLLSCGILFWVNLNTFGSLPYGVRSFVVGAFASLPMFFSGIVFIHSFSRTARKDTALGANLFGALAGALLQSISFITGIKSLLILVFVLYGLAALTRPQSVTSQVRP